MCCSSMQPVYRNALVTCYQVSHLSPFYLYSFLTPSQSNSGCVICVGLAQLGNSSTASRSSDPVGTVGLSCSWTVAGLLFCFVYFFSYLFCLFSHSILSSYLFPLTLESVSHVAAPGTSACRMSMQSCSQLQTVTQTNYFIIVNKIMILLFVSTHEPTS